MGEDEIVRLFNAKIKLERKQYKKRVLQLAPERIYQRAYQINCRENIAETLLEKSGEMKSEVLRCLLVLPNVIQFLYALTFSSNFFLEVCTFGTKPPFRVLLQ